MRVRQLIPTKFATAVGEHKEGRVIPTFVTWWMWLGKSFKVNRTVVPYGPIES